MNKFNIHEKTTLIILFGLGGVFLCILPLWLAKGFKNSQPNKNQEELVKQERDLRFDFAVDVWLDDPAKANLSLDFIDGEPDKACDNAAIRTAINFLENINDPKKKIGILVAYKALRLNKTTNHWELLTPRSLGYMYNHGAENKNDWVTIQESLETLKVIAARY